MKLIDLINRDLPAKPWQSGEKIPWNEPGFSRRMLQNHLAQDHDWASRRACIIDRQMEWLAKTIAKPGAAILDLGCGPGFYLQRLARRGYNCTGIDFSPAAIAYARDQAKAEHLPIAYLERDIRNYALAGPFDAVLLTFGEINVFTPADAAAILERASALLGTGGILVMEAHTFDEVRRLGLQPPNWQSHREGLFCERPHLLLQEQFWDEDAKTAAIAYWVVHDDGTVDRYGSGMQAYPEADYHELLKAAGFNRIDTVSPHDWPAGDLFADNLVTYICRK